MVNNKQNEIMEITKDNLHQAIAALRQCAKENENRQTDTGAVRVTDLCSDVADYLERQQGVKIPILSNSSNTGEIEIPEFEDYLRQDLNCYTQMVMDGKSGPELVEYIKLWVNGLMAAAREQIAAEINDGKLTDDYRQYMIREIGKADESKVVSYQLGLINAKKLIQQDTIVW